MFVLFQVTVLVNFNKPAVYLRHSFLKNIGNQTVLVTIDVQCQKNNPVSGLSKNITVILSWNVVLRVFQGENVVV